jgi:hypothetical protein
MNHPIREISDENERRLAAKPPPISPDRRGCRGKPRLGGLPLAAGEAAGKMNIGVIALGISS